MHEGFACLCHSLFGGTSPPLDRNNKIFLHTKAGRIGVSEKILGLGQSSARSGKELLDRISLLVREIEHQPKVVMGIGIVRFKSKGCPVGLNRTGNITQGVPDGGEAVVGLHQVLLQDERRQ